MRKLVLVLTLLVGFAFATSPLAMAQNDIDINKVAKVVLAAKADALLTALETPMADKDLPDGFSGAEFADPETATAEEGVLPSEDLDGTLGSIAYTLSYDPASTASPEAGAEATPELDMSALSFGFASVNYVVFDDELDSSDLEDFKDGAQKGIDQEEGQASVEDITIGDTDGVLLTYIIEDSGVQSAVQMVAIPVGNVMVMSMVVLASTEVDADAIQADSENLVLAGIEHLGNVADEAQ